MTDDVVHRVDLTSNVLDISRDMHMSVRQMEPGEPRRIDGYTLGVFATEHSAPHNGEIHPDGDEFLFVMSGRVRVIADNLDEPVELGVGEACIVRAGEWHRVEVLEKTQLIYLTPGPNGDHRGLE